MSFEDHPNTDAIQPMAMLPSSGDASCSQAMWTQRQWKHCLICLFWGWNLKFTIFCRSKVSRPRCGPRSAGRGSPWERRGRALETRETLKREKHLISIIMQNLPMSSCFKEKFWDILRTMLFHFVARGRWADRYHSPVCLFNMLSVKKSLLC